VGPYNKLIDSDYHILAKDQNQFGALVINTALQLFAYYIAKNKGTDIDKPRNLAKSVTVE
jgi:glucosamine 6-phosphate synthetase-like amidotransferase/phosphosugar isomerase protein